MIGYIYRYTFPDGKVYIGQTVRPVAARHREHTMPSSGRLNTAFWSAWQRFGEAQLDTLEIVYAENSEELTWKLDNLEMRYIRQYHALDPNYGYNRTRGGQNTNSSRKQLNKAFRAEFEKAWQERGLFYCVLSDTLHGSSMYKIQLDEEQAAFIKDFVLPNTDPEYGQFAKVSETGELIFDAQGNDFLEEESFSWLLFTVDELMQMEMDEVARDVEAYILENESVYLEGSVILKLDKAGNVIKEYANIAEIMNDLNLSYSTNIYNVLEGKQKTAYGYVWKWKK
jgi:hypothetical protein